MIGTIARAILRGVGIVLEAGRRIPGLAARSTLILLACAWAMPALATDWTFDWAALGWSPNGPGSMPRLYTNVAGSGIDVRVTVTWNNANWLNGTPLLNGSPGQGNELSLQVDFANISFNPKVNVVFQFFATGTATPAPVAIKGIAVRDIDRANYRDVVTATAIDGGGATINPDFISQFVATPNWVTGPGGGTCTGCTVANTVNSNGGGVAESNPSGWVAFNFASTLVRSMNLMYSAGDGNGNQNPAQQFVWLSDFVFSDTVVTTQTVIASFGVRGDGTVEWETASELGTAGFNLLRRDAATGTYVRLNDRLLPALVGSPQGGIYRFPDAGVRPGGTYTYGVEEVEATGSVRLYGPFTVVAGAGSPGFGMMRAQPQGAATPRPDGYTRQPHAPNGRVHEPLAAATASAQAAAAGKPNAAVRILVEDDGLYAVSADEIAAALGADPKRVRNWIAKNQLRLRQQGKPVAWMADPGNESLYFYGQVLAGDDRVHTRFNVYWLDQADGLRMNVATGEGPNPVAGVQSFPSRIHAEENTLPAQFLATDPDADFWYWSYVLAADPDLGARDFPVPAPGATRAGTATVRAYLHGATDLAPGSDHRARLLVNGTAVGDIAWDGIAQSVLTATFDASLLAGDGNNTLTMQGTLDAGVGYSVFWIEGFELDYLRAYQATGDQLRLSGAGNDVVTIGGFSSPNIAVLDIGDRRLPRWLSATTVTTAGTGYAVSFAPAKPSLDYFAAVAKAPFAVEGATPSPVTSWDSAAGYLVLTPRSLRTGADALAAYRGAKVVELQDIYDAFNFGIANPGAVRDFLAYASGNFRPKPRHVALVGKGTIDPKDYTGLGTHRFPVLLSPTPHGLFASDNRYADFDDDGLPELAIGRIPALTSEDVIRYVAKLAGYESGRGPANRALLVADVPDEGGNFVADTHAVAQALEAGGVRTTSLNLADMSVTDARQAIVDALNSPDGVALFNYAGHGGVNVLSNGAVFGNGDVSLLTNGARLPVFLAFTCAAGDGSYPGFDSLAETLLWREGGGAVAAVAPTGLSDNGQAHKLNLGLVEALTGRRAGATLGEAAAAALADLAKAGGERYMLDKYSVTGDPALRVRP